MTRQHLPRPAVVLAELTTAVGTAGLHAATRLPGLFAAIDQETTALRRTLGGDGRVPSAAALAGYAEGLVEAAACAGWRIPLATEVDWATADWLLVRLGPAGRCADRSGGVHRDGDGKGGELLRGVRRAHSTGPGGRSRCPAVRMLRTVAAPVEW